MKLLILIREIQRYDFVRFRLAAAAPVRFTNRNVDVPRARLTFANWKFEFRGVWTHSVSNCSPRRQTVNVTICELVHVRGREAESMCQFASLGTRAWATRRFTRSQFNIWYTCANDTPIHRVTTQHLEHVCGRHADLPRHKPTFGTRV